MNPPPPPEEPSPPAQGGEKETPSAGGAREAVVGRKSGASARDLKDSMKPWYEDFLLSLRFLTRLPVSRYAGDSPSPTLRRALRAFPLTGLVVGGVAGAVLIAGGILGLPYGVATVFALAAMTVATGGLHEDGLADTADALCADVTPEKRIAILGDSAIGAYGAMALIFTLLVKWAALQAIASKLPTGESLYSYSVVTALIGAACLSRAAMAAGPCFLEPVRKEGLAASIGKLPAYNIVAPAVLGGILAVLLLGGLAPAAAAIAVTAAIVFGMVVLARKRLGGYNGDVLGAIQQLSEAGALAAIAAAML